MRFNTLTVGDLVHWRDSQGIWDRVCIYRGPSFSLQYHWFDFLLENPDPKNYQRGGFHTVDFDEVVEVYGNIPGVEQVRWRVDAAGVFHKEN